MNISLREAGRAEIAPSNTACVAVVRVRRVATPAATRPDRSSGRVGARRGGADPIETTSVERPAIALFSEAALAESLGGRRLVD